MLLILFAVLFGFTLTAILVGFIQRWSRLDTLMMIALVGTYVAIWVTQPELSSSPMALVRELITGSVVVRTLWFMLGASVALLLVLVSEGVLDGMIAPVADRFGLNPPAPVPGPLGARDELLARLCLWAFQDNRRSILADLETVLSAGSGRRQHALHMIAAPGQTGQRTVEPKRLIATYRQHFDPTLASGPMIYTVLCRLAVLMGANTMTTTKRLHLIGHALGLDRGTMNRALSTA